MKTQEKNRYKFLATRKSSKKFKVKWNGIPAFMKNVEPQSSLYKHFFLSAINHIIFFLVLWGLFGVLKVKVINPILKQNEKIKDLEFVLDNSSRRGHKPKLGKSTAIAQNQEATKNNELKPAKNTANNNFSHIPTAIPDDFSIPVPKFKPASSNSGGLGRRSSNSSSGTASYGSNHDEIGSAEGSPNGNGSVNGGGFDKNATRKVVAAYDISPYVNELKRNVRMNWKPAKNSEGKYVELFLRIAKDGRLIILNVKRTSEAGDVDEAALNAVKRTLPLSPLPSKYSKSFLDLVFTFNSSSSSIGSRY